MAAVSGRKGRLLADVTALGTGAATPVALLKDWSLDLTTDNTDVTAFGDATRLFVPGIPSASGSFSGYFDTAGAQFAVASSVASGRKLYLYPNYTDNPTLYWFGTAHFDLSVSTGVDAAVEISGTFNAASVIASSTGI
jgi:hypothetical protein